MINRKTICTLACAIVGISAMAQQENKEITQPTTDSIAASTTLSAMPLAMEDYAWGLHQGLNATIGMSAFATLGKNVPHKGGFNQSVNATYLAPLSHNGKLWVAGGGYFTNTFWGGDSFRDAGLYALLGYKINEKWEVYTYGQLSLANNYNRLYTPANGRGLSRYAYYNCGFFGTSPLGYGLGTSGANVIGAGVKYNITRDITIGVNVEGAWYGNNGPQYFDQYNYPTPKP